jgi:stearoyl-CoA desaturase (delta-9 desaturase)
MAKWKENIVAVLATLSTSGTTLQYATVHRYHHVNSDNGKDLHSPYEIGFYKSFFHWYEKDPTQLAGLSYIKDLLRKPLLIKLHEYYFLVIALYVLSLILIDPVLVIFCYILPVGYTWFNGGALSLPLHIKGAGYRNFETDDFTNNSHFWNWLTLGEGLHNNHHARPGEYNFAFTKNPGEWDFSAWIVDKFLIEKYNG